MPYQPIQATSLETGVTFHRPEARLDKVTLDSPALEVMTDFKKTTAVTIDSAARIDTAKEKMIQRGVRLLLAIDHHEEVVGVITASDINGEKSVIYSRDFKVPHKDIEVGDIMSPRAELDVLRIEDVSRARVGDIVQTLLRDHRQHALVVDRQGRANGVTIRGVISITQIARQIGREIQLDVDINIGDVAKKILTV